MKHSSHWSPQILGTLPLDKIRDMSLRHLCMQRNTCANVAALPGYTVSGGVSSGVSSWTTPEWNPVKALTGFHSAVVQEAVVRKRSTMLRLLKQKRSTSSTWREHLRSEETHKVISETSKLGLPDATTECDERMQWWDAMMCIPSRTPVSSGLRSTKAFFKWNITPTHPDPTDVILAIRRDTQEILWNVATWADDVFTNGCCKLACNDALGQKRRRHVDLQFSKCSKT